MDTRYELASPTDLATACDPRYERRPALELVSRQLARMLTGEVTRLMVWLPPQSGKTTLGAVWVPFWWLAHQPADRSVVAAYSQAVAGAQSHRVRRLVDAHGERYGLLRDGTNTNWWLASGGRVAGIGVGNAVNYGPVTGIAVLDDPYKNEFEAASPQVRERVHDWYRDEFLTHLAPATPLLLIYTPCHDEDLGHTLLEREGRVEDGGVWTVIDAMP